MSEKNILLKIHEGYRLVIAICDKELKNKKFLEGNKKLDLTGPFFQGKEVNEKEALEEIEKATYEDATFNIVGKKSIITALKAGIINEEGIMHIQGVPYALVLV